MGKVGSHPWLRYVGLALAWLIAALLTVWSIAALAIDFPVRGLRYPVAALYFVILLVVLVRVRGQFRRIAACVGGFVIVAACWLSLKPSNHRQWQADVSETPWAEVNGDQVMIHNFRNCDYRAEFDYTCQWLDKKVALSELRGIDVAVTYWGSPYIAHPIVSFQFGDDDYVAASIETRKQIGEGYSAVRGFFRQYELIYIFAAERDLIRLRTNYRHDEDVYLYHTTAGPEWSRALFLEYVRRANELHVHPEWYNAATSNCTTNIFEEMALTGRLPAGSKRHDWRILLNGKADEMLYDGGNLAGNLPFAQLKERVHINDVAHTVNEDPDFSRRIRVGRPGFEFLTALTR